MTPELVRAIAKTKALFKERNRAEDWSQNIVEGSEGLSSRDDWTRYYNFLADPEGFDPEAPVGQTINPAETIEPLPSTLKSFETQNGTETIIHVRNVGCMNQCVTAGTLEEKTEDDEKQPHVTGS